MKNQTLLICLFFLLPLGGCKPGHEELTAADCEGTATESGCMRKGCTFVTIHRAIMDGAQCIATEQRPGCLAAGESVNNVTGALCRDLPGGGFEFVNFSSARPADGWQDCGGDPSDLCEIFISTCRDLQDRAACEAEYCYWADPVRVGVVDDQGSCTGWEAQTVGMCLTPEPYLTYLDGVSGFDRGATERVFAVTPVEGPRRIYSFSVSAFGDFTSGPPAVPDSWRACDVFPQDPGCDCP